MERTYGDIEWEVEDVFETDLDGHGTQEVSISGFARCAEGGGHFEFEGTATRSFPYDDLEEINIESTKFIPDEPEPEDL